MPGLRHGDKKRLLCIQNKIMDILKIFDPLLLCNVTVSILSENGDERVIRSGKLISVVTKNNVSKLKVSENDIIRDVELFYPFNLVVNDNIITFDYTLKHIYQDNVYLKAIINSKRTDESMPLINSKILIKKIK